MMLLSGMPAGADQYSALPACLPGSSHRVGAFSGQSGVGRRAVSVYLFGWLLSPVQALLEVLPHGLCGLNNLACFTGILRAKAHFTA